MVYIGYMWQMHIPASAFYKCIDYLQKISTVRSVLLGHVLKFWV